jgi:hypothetical protein
MVHPVLDLLPARFDEAVRTITYLGELGGQGMTSSGGEKIAASEDPRPDGLPGVKGALHADIDEVGDSGRADAHHTGL